MGRRVTWVVVGAVAAVAVAAAVEALRGVSSPQAGSGPPSPTTAERAPAAVAQPALPISGREDVQALLEAAGGSGVLYFADRTCRLRTLELPGVDWRPEPNRPVPCRFTADASGAVSPDGVRIEPQSGLRAVCHESGIDVFDRDGTGLLGHRGACAPAWRPDGTLTFIRDGELVLAPGLRETRVLLSRGDLARAVGHGASLEEVAWFDDDEYAAAVRRGSEVVLAVFRGAELVLPPSFSAPSIEGLRATRRSVAARTGGSESGVRFLSRGGRELLAVPGGHAVSWSPGGTVAAVAARSAVVFVDPATRERAPLALVATDLEWR
ncbi:MAG: hypothetical protein ACRDOS_07765 [Gaiellaceae bacterium]